MKQQPNVATPCPAPCKECPFVEGRTRGFVGPYTPEDLHSIATGETAFPCHMTMSDATGPRCRGIDLYRNQLCKSPRDPAERAAQAETVRVHGATEKAVAPFKLAEYHSRTESVNEIDFTSPGDGELSSVERTTVSRRIEELAAQYGSVTEVANRLGVNAIYLHRLANGSKTSPSEDVIKKLGLRRIVSYVRCV